MQLYHSATSLAASITLGCAALLAVSCTDSSPKRIDQKATVTRAAEDGAEETAVQGRSFTDPAPLADEASAAVDDGSLPGEDGAPSGRAVASQLDMTGAGGGLAAQNPAMAAFLNPQLAAGLREDPGQTAAGTIDGLVTFGDLSLLGADIDELLDYIYKPETEAAKRFKFPDKVLEKAGEDKAIVGYMIALEYKPRTTDVTSFMLVRDLQACCFGGVPRPDEWVMVEMEEGKTCEYFMYVPVTVRGTFTPGRVEDEYGYASAIYNLEATSVERYEPPAAPKNAAAPKK